IKPVLARNRFEQQGHIGSRGGNGTGMVQRQFDRKYTRIGDKAKGRFETVCTAPATRDSNRATLVATDRHIALTSYDQRGTAAGGAACRVSGMVWVQHRPGIGGKATA